MKLLLFIVCALACGTAAFAQQQNGDIHISRGKIFLNNGTFVDGQPIVITQDSVEFYSGNSTLRSSLDLIRVEKIQKYNGNWGTTGAWVGSILGVGVGIIAAAGTEETTTTGNIVRTRIQIWPVYVGAVIGGLVGLLIGKSSEDMKTVYSRPHHSDRMIGIDGTTFGEVRASYAVQF